MHVRQALPGDANLALEWLNSEELWRVDNPDDFQTTSLETFAPKWAHMLARESVWMLEDADQVFGQVGWVDQYGLSPELFITIAVPVYRRAGFGTRALKWLEDQALARGYTTLCAQVLGNNQAGLKFFERCGYSTTTRIDNRVLRNNGCYPLYGMEKSLS